MEEFVSNIYCILETERIDLCTTTWFGQLCQNFFSACVFGSKLLFRRANGFFQGFGFSSYQYFLVETRKEPNKTLDVFPYREMIM